MKVYISADMEGITGVTHWDEVTKGKPDYPYYQTLMTAEVVAACEGALSAGAEDIVVKDAHATGRNILPAELPPEAKLISGWSGHPLAMIQDLEETFDALIMIGYHSRAGSDGNPLSHTMSSSKLAYLKINDRLASEFLLHGYAAAQIGVPVVCVSGDQKLCDDIYSHNKNITTVAVKEGIGNSAVHLQPKVAQNRIREAVKKALKNDPEACYLPRNDRFQIEIGFKNHPHAYRASFYPGVILQSDQVIQYVTDEFFEVMRLITFVL